MVFRLFRRSGNRAVIERLYGTLVAAARQPALYARFGIPDTFEGRFESVTLHAALVLRRLNALPAPGPDVAQDLVDSIFRHFDATLREMGVGDTAVPKRMKRLAEAFLGRSAAYDEALRNGGAGLADALARNIPAERDAPAFTRYVTAAAAVLDATPLAVFLEGGDMAFPEPSAFLEDLP